MNAFLLEKVFDPKNFFLSLDLFIMALCSLLAINGAFPFSRCMFIKNTEDCILKTFQITSTNIKFADIRPKLTLSNLYNPDSLLFSVAVSGSPL